MAFKMKGFPQHSGVKTKGLGPRATKKSIKEETHNEMAIRTEGPEKLQTVRRKGLTPHSQKFSNKAFLKSQKEEEVKRSDLDQKGKKIYDTHRKKKSPAKKLNDPSMDKAEYHYGDNKKEIISIPSDKKDKTDKVDKVDKVDKEKTPKKSDAELKQENKDKKKAKRKEWRKGVGKKLKSGVAEVGKDVAKAALTDALTPKEKQIVNKTGNFNVKFGR